MNSFQWASAWRRWSGSASSCQSAIPYSKSGLRQAVGHERDREDRFSERLGHRVEGASELDHARVANPRIGDHQRVVERRQRQALVGGGVEVAALEQLERRAPVGAPADERRVHEVERDRLEPRRRLLRRHEHRVDRLQAAQGERGLGRISRERRRGELGRGVVGDVRNLRREERLALDQRLGGRGGRGGAARGRESEREQREQRRRAARV